jgi:hypothetical protein
MEDKKVILGLDVSTTTIGICLMVYENNEPKIVKLTHISPKISTKIKGIECLFLKKNIFENEFLNEYKDYGITDVIIEEPLLNSNNVYTVATLLRFNGMISESVYRTLGIVPEYISSHDSRKYSFPELLTIRKYDKKGNIYPLKHIKKSIKDNNLTLFGGFHWDVAKKDVMHGLIADKYPDINWIYDKNGELKKENFDASDASVCCLSYINKITNGELTATITKVEETQDEINYEVSVWDRIYKHKINLK